MAKKVIIAKHAGFCPGVARAVKKALATARAAPKPIQILGDIVHNEEVSGKLRAAGVRVVNSVDEVTSGTLIITAHGIDPAVVATARDKNLNVVDTTCPLVALAHQRARELRNEGRTVLILGDKEHVEVRGINGAIEHRGLVFSRSSELESLHLPEDARVGLVSQTTSDVRLWESVQRRCRELFADCRVFDTVCAATKGRQGNLAELIPQVEAMVIVGGKTSGNTRRLFEKAREFKPAYWIQTEADLEPAWFADVTTVGIAAGASTPKETIQRVARATEAMD